MSEQSGSSRYSIDTLLFPGLTSGERKVKMEWEDDDEAANSNPPQGEEKFDISRSDDDEEAIIGGMMKGPKLKAPSGWRRNGMFDVFQPWVLRTYGDSAKTKTITRKKAARIVKTLRGEELNNAENSKFRFWVKAKGFQLGPPGGQEHPASSNEPQLYVPTTVKNGTGGVEKAVYKRVAVVEFFFDIIYRVHVETEAKNGKHAGQKRTYRAITEKYAFLPREAVTKFLLQCTDCQKRGSPGVSEDLSPGKTSSRSSSRSGGGDQLAKGSANKGPLGANSRLPFQLRGKRKQMSEGFAQDIVDDDEECQFSDANSGEDEIEVRPRGKGKDGGKGEDRKDVGWLGAYSPLVLKKEGTNNNVYSNGKGSSEFRDQQSSPTSLSLSERLGGGNNTSHGVDHGGGGGGGGGGHDETGSNGAKDDEDDEDDESEDKMDTHQYDPERLKAFNMFVRLFVDENLDRMVPISKQPKEKIQAIIDSCTRQFPEFAERARKRIRTYLKSCRRNKRSRDGGWESSRPTPAHLTSVQAEQILAQACENESQNAKRMRMGLEPVSQPLPNSSSESRKEVNGGVQSNGSSQEEKPLNGKMSSSSASNIAATIAAVASNTTNSRDGGGCVSPAGSSNGSGSSSDHNNASSNAMHLSGINGDSSGGGLGLPVSKSLVDRTNNPLVDFRGLNGSAAVTGGLGMFRGALGGFAGGAFPRPPLPSPFPTLFPSATGGLPPPPLSLTAAAPTSFSPTNVSPLPPTSVVSSLLSNGDAGPTDLSMKSAKAMPLGGVTSMSQKLNASELATVRQLITGYRESAAFLLRSADELEQLLLQQQ